MSTIEEKIGETLGSIFGDFDSLETRCLKGDRSAMREALDSCKASKRAVPDWLWRSLDASCRGVKAIFQ